MPLTREGTPMFLLGVAWLGPPAPSQLCHPAHFCLCRTQKTVPTLWFCKGLSRLRLLGPRFNPRHHQKPQGSPHLSLCIFLMKPK